MAKKPFLDGYKTYDTSKGFGNAGQWRHAFHQRMSKQDAENLLQSQLETPQSILAVGDKAKETEIKKAFRKKVMEWHPDKNQHRLEEAETMTKKIIAAYTVLMEKE